MKLPVRYVPNNDNDLLPSELSGEGVAGSIMDADDNYIARIWFDYADSLEDGHDTGKRIAAAINAQVDARDGS